MTGFYWGHLQPPSLTNDFIYGEKFQKDVRLKYKDWRWTPNFSKLLLFREQNGHTRVLKEDELGRWREDQANLRWELPERRRQRLDDIGFEWDWRDTSTNATAALPEQPPSDEQASPKKNIKPVRFQTRMSQLRAYRNGHENCEVPLDWEVEGLGEWVEDVRRRRRDFTPGTVERFLSMGLEFYPDEDDDDETSEEVEA